jgi:hypothetical protein
LSVRNAIANAARQAINPALRDAFRHYEILPAKFNSARMIALAPAQS